jgi:hypothetical protein
MCTGPLLVCSECTRRSVCGHTGAQTCCRSGTLQGARAGRAPAAPVMRRNTAHSGAIIASGGARCLRPLGQAHEVRVHEQRAVARRHRRHLHRRCRVLPGAQVHQPLRATAPTASRTLSAVRLPCGFYASLGAQACKPRCPGARVHGSAGELHASQCAGAQCGRAGHAISCVTDWPCLLPAYTIHTCMGLDTFMHVTARRKVVQTLHMCASAANAASGG